MSVNSEKVFAEVNNVKTNFDSIYNMRDPRDYYRVLVGLDYIIPDLARGIFISLIRSLRERLQRRVRVLDIGCSYGTNAALARFPLDISRLSTRYNDPAMQLLSPDELMALDANYFRSWPEVVDAEFYGLDVSGNAVTYACKTGLLAGGVIADLEATPLKSEHVDILRGVDLIISTGCVGYVTVNTFKQLLNIFPDEQMPWIANFVLRMFPYDSLGAFFEQQKLTTEKLEGVTFVQRRFHSAQECESVLEELVARDIDPGGKEADGLYHAELFVSRPKQDILKSPLSELISVTSGANRHYGRRYRAVASGDVKLFR